MKKIEYQTLRVGSCFNCVVEMNQNILIWKRSVTKYDYLCDDDN